MQSLKKIKSLIGDDVPMKDFFCSTVFSSHLKNIARMVGDRYDSVLHVKANWDTNKNDIAYTDNKLIYLNLDNCIVNPITSITDRYLMYLGFLAHECGHVLFTDFTTMEQVKDALVNKTWFPEHPQKSKKNLNEYNRYLTQNKINTRLVFSIISNLDNILEDKYVNNRMRRLYPGTFKEGLNASLKEMFGNYSVNPNILNACLNKIHYYGQMQIEDAFVLENWDVIKELVDSINNTHNPLDRLKITNEIFMQLYPTLKPLIVVDSAPNQNGQGDGNDSGDNSRNSGQNNPENSSQNSSNGQTGTDTKGKANSQQGNSNAHLDISQMSEAQLKELAKEITNQIKGGTTIGSGKGIAIETGDVGEVGGLAEGGKDREDQSSQDADSDEEELSSLQQLLNSFIKQELSKDENFVQELLDRKAIEEVCGCAECDHNVPFELNKKINSNKYEYNKIYSEVKPLSKRLQYEIVNVLEDKRSGGIARNLPFGRRIDPASTVRGDGKVFIKNKLPEDYPQLAVCILIDQSGSMSGKRITQARKTAIIVEDFCRAIGIPVCVVGHCVSGKVRLYQYIDFDETSSAAKYKLASIHACGCNRDGFALRYCLNKIRNREEDTKLLITINDGQPNDLGYRGKIAYEDLKATAKECEKSNVNIFATAIGEDKDILRKIYGEAFLDISDIKQLPVKMIRLIKKYL